MEPDEARDLLVVEPIDGVVQTGLGIDVDLAGQRIVDRLRPILFLKR